MEKRKRDKIPSFYIVSLILLLLGNILLYFIEKNNRKDSLGTATKVEEKLSDEEKIAYENSSILNSDISANKGDEICNNFHQKYIAYVFQTSVTSFQEYFTDTSIGCVYKLDNNEKIEIHYEKGNLENKINGYKMLGYIVEDQPYIKAKHI